MRSALAALLLAIAALAAWWWWPAAAPASAMPESPAAGEASAHAVAAPPLAALERAVAGASVPRVDAPPIPAGAAGVEVRVVDWATREVVAHADVWWLDAAGEQRVAALPEAERERLWHDSEAKARELGRHARTDERGVVQVTARSERTDVWVRDGERVGATEVYASQAAEGVELELSRERMVGVRVVDLAGTPVGGVPLELRMNEGSDTCASDAAGTARFLYREHWAGREAVPDWAVHVSIPGLERCAATFAWSSPPAEPLTLVLPATGELHVHVVHPGRAVESLDASIRIGAPDDRDAKLREWRLEADAERVARFRPVPLGATFEVLVRVGDLELQRTVGGPVVAGQIVRTNVDVPADAVALVGRVLHEDGRPVASESVWLASNLHRSRMTWWIRTDARGCFVWHPAAIDDAPPRELTELRLSLRYGPLDDIAHGTVAPRTLQPGVNDLGDIRLERPPVVAAGRFECTGEPRHVPFAVARWHDAESSTAGGRWQEERQLWLYQHDGRFVVCGAAPPGRLRLTFGDHAQAVEFAPGARGLVVPLIGERR